jgi:paraquat-inducible protein B
MLLLSGLTLKQPRVQFEKRKEEKGVNPRFAVGGIRITVSSLLTILGGAICV